MQTDDLKNEGLDKKSKSGTEKRECLAEKIGYTFKNPKLLVNALTHTSYANEKYSNESHLKSNERLEFVGDAVVGLIVGGYLYKTFPKFSEGKMSKLRAAVVCEEALADLARSLGVDKCIRLGMGEYKTGGMKKDSLLSDAMESIVAAVYIDSDFDTAKNIFLPYFIKMVDEAAPKLDEKDAKSTLQEKLAKKALRVSYSTIDRNGPAHDMVFTVAASVELHNTTLSQTAQGKTIREAEQRAAEKMLKNPELSKILSDER